MKRTVADFLERFVLPLVRGGEMAIGKPIGAEEIQAFEDELPYATEPLVAVDESRTEIVSEVVVRPPALVLDADELYLAAAVHNVLFLSHPRASSFTITGKAERKVLETAIQFASQPFAEDSERVLARHGLLHNLFDVSRTDYRLSWWTGSAIFHGQRPPGRLTAWRAVRRVREETISVGYAELLGGADVQPVLTALLRRSPLTHLLCSGRRGPELLPPLHWEDAVFLLREPELARAVTYQAIGPGEPHHRVRAPARFAAAFEQMLERAPAEPDVRAVAAFLVHLNVLLALAEIGERDPSARSPILTTVLDPDRAGQRPRGLATFFALPDALARVDPRLAEPPGLRQEPELLTRWQQQRAQVAEGIGEAVIETLATRLRRHLTGVLESPESHHGEPADG